MNRLSKRLKINKKIKIYKLKAQKKVFIRGKIIKRNKLKLMKKWMMDLSKIEILQNLPP